MGQYLLVLMRGSMLAGSQICRGKISGSSQGSFETIRVSISTGAFSIPVQSSLIFVIELPSQAEEGKMGEIVSTEARKYIPVPINEVSIDYFILPKRIFFEEMNSTNNADTSQKSTEK